MGKEVKLFANPVLPAPNRTHAVHYSVSLLRDAVFMDRRPRDVLSGSTGIAKACGIGRLRQTAAPRSGRLSFLFAGETIENSLCPSSPLLP